MRHSSVGESEANLPTGTLDRRVIRGYDGRRLQVDLGLPVYKSGGNGAGVSRE